MMKLFSEYTKRVSVRQFSKVRMGINKEKTTEQFQRLRNNHKFANILAEMQTACRQLQEKGQLQSISSEQIAKMLEKEKENAKYSIY